MRNRYLLIGALVAVVAAALGVVACGAIGDPRDGIEPEQPARADGDRESFGLTRIAAGLNRPTWVGAAPGDPGALWAAEQPGRVVRLVGDRRRVVVDMTRDVKLGAEQGLLGIAFHPDFKRNRRLFVHFSDRRGDTRVLELTLRRGAEPRRRQLLFQRQPEENHNGGALVFGLDGRLYLGLGDGGGAFDPHQNAQNLDSKLGKLIAADVDAPGDPRWEVVLYGLRNPWRFWIDAALGEVWIGDVGQDEVEEVDRVLLEPDEPPKNLGWSAFEGAERGAQDRAVEGPGDLVWPIAVYDHGDGGHCSITGGLVYRGGLAPELTGRYVYGDFCSGTLWSLRPTPEGGARDVRREKAKVPQITHIGTDSDGELVLASASGDLYRAGPAR
jgi:glucose/arabinose dehydrogenase